MNEKKEERSTHKNILNITFTAMFVAIIAALSQVSIPMPNMVPITLQTFAVLLSGYFLGSEKGTLSVLIYILLGAVGAPVFASFKGGFAVLLGYTGGFIWGFIPLAFLCGIRCHRKWLGIILGICGTLACHLLGALQYMILSGRGFFESLALVSFPYLLKDIVLVPLAYLISSEIKKRIKYE